MRALGFTVKKAEIRQMIAAIDKEEDSTVTFQEFVDMMTPKMVRALRIGVCSAAPYTPTVPQAERDSREEIMKVFELFDEDHTGAISFRNLKKIATELGENLTDEEMRVCS